MKYLKTATFLFLATLIAACSGVQVKVSEPKQFAAGNYQTYSWRSEPFRNVYASGDPIYVIDPILRKVVDRDLQAKGYQLVPRGGDFTVDYIYAPGMLMGAPSDDVSNISPRAGVRPNTGISQAERDNAIALSGVRETRNVALQFNDGDSGLEVWRAVMTAIVADANKVDRDSARNSLKSGVSKSFRELPNAGG